MAYKALYRTYRPTTFEEVAGQQHVVKTIKNALASGKIAHAYLFAGPRGTGKTTMAKLLAKALNCDHGIGCQCNECKNCTAIMDGSHPDVLEIDAASNNGVDQVRDLIDRVKYGTSLGRYKVYIIDEVHMMTAGAFNALLKTLEEPPEHVIFILATTEPHKILPTILSRCQRYDFSKVSDEDIKQRIKTVLEKEGIVYNDEAINLIISLADGGMRDALSILDQVLAYSGDKLSVQGILDIFALESKEEKLALLTSICDGNVPDILERLGHYIQRGTDIKRLTNDLLLILKDVLIYQTSGNTRFLQALEEPDVEQLDKLIDSQKALEMIDVLMDALKDYKNVTAINPLFEVTLLKLATMQKGNPQKQVQKPVETRPLRYETPAPKGPSEDKEREIKQQAKVVEQKPVVKEEPKKEPEPMPLFTDDSVASDENIIYINGTEKGDSFDIDSKTIIEIMVTSTRDIKDGYKNNWANLKRLALHPTLGRIASMLADGKPLVASKKVILIEFSSASVVEKLRLISNQKDIQNIIRTVFNKKVFAYPITRDESVEAQKRYINMQQTGTLPKANNVVLDIIGD